MNRIPFTLPEIGPLDLREVKGLVWIEDGFLVLEVTNALLGEIDHETEIVKIEPAALMDIYVKFRPFKDRLVLVPKKKDLLDAIPGKHVNDVRLRIWRTKRTEVQRLIAECIALRSLPRPAVQTGQADGSADSAP